MTASRTRGSGAEGMRALPRRGLWLRSVVVGTVLLASGLLLAVVVAHNRTAMNENDLPLNTRIHEFGLEHGFLRTIAKVVSWLGSGSHTVPTVLAFLALLLLKRRWRWALFLAASAELGLLISRLLKAGVARSRPPWVHFSGPELGASFPSGHTFGGITSWVAMGIVMLFILRRPSSTILGSILITIGVLNGPSRLILGQHWVTDVAGSLLLSIGWLLIVSGVCLRLWGRDDIEAPIDVGIDPSPEEDSGGGAAAVGEIGPSHPG